MTEAQWLACTDPSPMLNFLRNKTSDRKFRLFAVACCCRILRLLTDQRSINAVLVADRYVEGEVTLKELKEATVAARRAYENAFQIHDNAALATTYLAAEGYKAAMSAAAYAGHAVGHELAEGGGSQAEVHEQYTAGQT